MEILFDFIEESLDLPAETKKLSNREGQQGHLIDQADLVPVLSNAEAKNPAKPFGIVRGEKP